MSEQKKGVHHAIRLSHYSASKDEYLDIEDMAQEHLVNMLYKICLLYTSPSPRD